MAIQLAIPTAEGVFTAHYSEHGLAKLEFPAVEDSERRKKLTTADQNYPPLLGERDGVRAGVSADSTTNYSPTVSAEIRRWHRLTTDALADALAGRAPRELPPLDLSAGTNFQRRVWSALRRIASGRTRSYAEVAVAIGSPRAAAPSAAPAAPIPFPSSSPVTASSPPTTASAALAAASTGNANSSPAKALR